MGTPALLSIVEVTLLMSFPTSPLSLSASEPSAHEIPTAFALLMSPPSLRGLALKKSEPTPQTVRALACPVQEN